MSEQQKASRSRPKGRKAHNFYEYLQYTTKRLENGRTGAQCIICSTILKNTAIARLRTHRKRCQSYLTNGSSISETYLGSSAVAFKQDYSNDMQFPMETPSSQKDCETEEIRVEQILLGVDAKSETGYDPILVRNDEVNPLDRNDTLQNIPSSEEEYAYGASYAMQPSSSSFDTSDQDPSDLEMLDPDPKLCRNVNKNWLEGHKSNKPHGHRNTVAPNLKEKIDLYLAKFFFGCNIPFSLIDSEHFKNFVKMLKPEYSLPSKKTLSTVLLDKVYDDITDKRHLSKESTLLIDGWKNPSDDANTVITTLQTTGGQSLFLDKYDLPMSRDTDEIFADICENSVVKAHSRFNCKIYAVVSNTVSSVSGNNSVWHITCNSHIANLLSKDIADVGTITKIYSILNEFKRANLENLLLENGGTRVVLPMDTRGCSNRDACVSFKRNLPVIKKIIEEEDIKFKPEVTDTLHDNNFIDYVNATIILLNPISELIRKCQSMNFSIADAVQEWAILKNKMLESDGYKENITDGILSRFKMAMNIYGLTANYLHPVYRGKQLNDDQLNDVQDFLLDVLDGPGLEGLHAFNTNVGVFRQLNEKKVVSVDTFWALVGRRFPTLAALAVKLLRIPAASAPLEKVFYDTSIGRSDLNNRLTKERSKKLLFVYHSLKLRDSYCSDQY